MQFLNIFFFFSQYQQRNDQEMQNMFFTSDSVCCKQSFCFQVKMQLIQNSGINEFLVIHLNIRWQWQNNAL